MRSTKLEVLSNVQVSRRYWHMTIDASKLKESIQPGQFFNIRCGEAYEPFLRRPFSIYRINSMEQTIEFLYLVKGAGTQRIAQIEIGEKVDVFGPLGKGFVLKDEWDTILLLARGVGIATLAALAQQAAEKGTRSIAILSARTHNDLLATKTLEKLGTEVYHVTEEDGTSDVAYVQKLIESIIKTEDIKAAYTCGSRRLSILLQNITKEKQIPAEIALEEHMGCAMGVCFACVCDIEENNIIHSVRVCREGPVFPLEKVVFS
jgi:dihydroorotate dehydrogenase electron transfer subunit